MRKTLSVASGLLLMTAFLCAPPDARGQGNTWVGTSLKKMVDAARWKFGVLRVNAALEISNAGYDSDVYYGYRDDPAPDFTLTAGVPVQVLLPASTGVVFEIQENPQYSYYAASERERAANNILRGRMHVALERTYIAAGGGLTNVRSRLSSELDILVREKTRSLDGIAFWQVSPQSSLALSSGVTHFDYGESEFEGANIAGRLGRKEMISDLIAYFQPSQRVRLFLDGRYGTYAFKEATATTRNSRSYGVFGGFEFVPREGELVAAIGLEGGLSLGYTWFDLKDPELTDGSGLAGEADISIGLTRRTTVRGFYARGFEFSVFSGANYYFSSTYGGGIMRRLSRRTTLSYNISFGRTYYPEYDSGTPSPETTNRFLTHMASLNVALARDFSVALTGTFGSRFRGETGEKRTRNFIGVSILYGYPPASFSAPARKMGR